MPWPLNTSAYYTVARRSFRRLSVLSFSRCVALSVRVHIHVQQRHAFHRIGAMPPKQATLGYVRPSQTTLTCGISDHDAL